MYIVIGGDGKEYGPKASVEVRDWIREGRLNALSQIKEQGDDEWKVLGNLQEFAADFAGGIAGAQEASAKAKMWCWIGFGIGIPVTILYVALQVAAENM